MSRFPSAVAPLLAITTVLLAGTFATAGAAASAHVSPPASRAVGGSQAPVNASSPGLTWAKLHGVPLLAGENSLQTACSSPTACIALVGGGGSPSRLLYTTDGGRSWGVTTMPGIGYVKAITCAPDSSGCWAVGTYDVGNGVGFADESPNPGDGIWLSKPLPAGVNGLESISCPTSLGCVATGSGPQPAEPAFNTGEIIETTDGGQSWSETIEPDFFPGAVDCADALHCEATAVIYNEVYPLPDFLPAAVIGTSDGGASWSQQYVTTDPNGAYFDSIACPNDLDCYAAGLTSSNPSLKPGTPMLLATTDGGTTWAAQQLPLTTPPPDELASGAVVGPCLSATACWGWDYTPIYTSDGGTHWAVSAGTIAGGEAVGPQVCPSSTVCYGVASRPSGRPGQLGVVSTFDAQGLGCSGTLTGPAAGIAERPGGSGYWVASANGGVVACGTATFYGSPATSGMQLSSPIVAMAAVDTGEGYYLMARNGTVYPFGPGTLGRRAEPPPPSTSPFVGIAVDQTGFGYWLVAANGGVFAIDAPFNGSLPGLGVKTNDVVGVASPPSGGGYWLVGQNGGIYAFGLRFSGSLPGLGVRVDDIVGMIDTSIGRGYDLVGADGGVFAVGAGVPFCGSATGRTSAPVISVAGYDWSGGYWLLGRDGALYDLGAPDDGGPWSSPEALASCG